MPTLDQLSWEVPTPHAPRTPKSPVQRRLEQSAERLEKFGTPPPLVLPPSKTGHYVRREELLRRQQRANARRVRHAKQVAKQKRLERNQEKERLAKEIELKLFAAAIRREEAMKVVKMKASNNRAYLHNSTETVSQRGTHRRRRSSVRLNRIQRFHERLSQAEHRRRAKRASKVNRVKCHLKHVEKRRQRVITAKRVQAWWRSRMSYTKALENLQSTDLVKQVKVLLLGNENCMSFLKEKNCPAFDVIAAHLSGRDALPAAMKVLASLKRFSRTASAMNSNTNKFLPRSSGDTIIRASEVKPTLLQGENPTNKTLSGMAKNGSTKQKRGPSALTVASRKLLSAIMLIAHPAVVLGLDDGATEEDRRVGTELRSLAIDMLYALDKIVEATRSTPSSEFPQMRNRRIEIRTKVFFLAKQEYDRQFAAWKANDELKLAREMMASYVSIRLNSIDLEQRILSIDADADNDPGVQQMRSGLERQAQSIVARVKRLLGDKAGEWISESELRVAEAARVQGLEHDSGVNEATASEMSMSDQSETEAEPEPNLPPVAIVNERGSRWMPSNAQMVHELLVDDAYKISKPETLSVDQTEAFKLLLDTLTCGDFSLVRDALIDIRNRLSELTPNRQDLHSALQQHIDVESLNQQFLNGAFDIRSFSALVQYICSQVKTLQAAAREEKFNQWLTEFLESVKEAEDSEDGNELDWLRLVPEALDRLLGEIATIELDLANYHLAMLSASLPREQGVAYLKSKWTEIVQEQGLVPGTIQGTRRTLRWVSDSSPVGARHGGATTLASVDPQVEPEPNPSPPPSPPLSPIRRSAVDIALRGFASLMGAATHMEVQPFRVPEMIAAYDIKRLGKFRDELAQIATIGALELMINQTVSMSLRGQTTQLERNVVELAVDEMRSKVLGLFVKFNSKLWWRDENISRQELSSVNNTVYHEIAQIAIDCARAQLRGASSESLEVAENQLPVAVGQIVQGIHPMCKVLFRKLVQVATTKRNSSGSGAIARSLERLRLVQWQSKVSEIALEISSLASLYRDVYGDVLTSCYECARRELQEEAFAQ